LIYIMSCKRGGFLCLLMGLRSVLFAWRDIFMDVRCPPKTLRKFVLSALHASD
jgi:hypothetical protein